MQKEADSRVYIHDAYASPSSCGGSINTLQICLQLNQSRNTGFFILIKFISLKIWWFMESAQYWIESKNFLAQDFTSSWTRHI